MAQEGVTNGCATATVEKSVATLATNTIKTMLIVEAQKVGDAVTFYKSAFDAVESGHSLYPKRKLDQELPHLLSSELKLAGSSFVVRDVSTLPDSSTTKSAGSGVFFVFESDDVEAAVAKAVDAGAVKKEITEVETEEYGVKGKVTDPFGLTWIFAKITENVVVAENDENKEV